MELLRVKLSYSFRYFPLLRQTPEEKGIWGGIRFVTDADDDATEGPFDAWVVYNNLAIATGETIFCPPERTVLIVGEPPSRTEIPPAFAAQFAAVVTCLPRVQHHEVRRIQQALPWWVGIERSSRFTFSSTMGYDELASMTDIPKTQEISIVCSNLAITPYHRRRVRFVRTIANHFGNRLALFGDGFTPILDKWDAIAPFKYHIVLENSQVSHYWTEKLADAYLGAALPIYCGCPNIEEYFPSDSLIRIDLNDPDQAIVAIEALLADDPYSRVRESIWVARRRVLDEYNLFPMIVNLLDDLPAGRCQQITLRPSGAFSQSLQSRIRRMGCLAREAVTRTIFKLGER